MKTIYWIIIGVVALGLSVVVTMMVVKKMSVKDEEDTIDEAVKRLTFGVSALGGDLAKMHLCGPNNSGDYYYTSRPCSDFKDIPPKK